MILRAIIIIEQFKLLEVVEPGGSKYGINDGKVTRTVVAPTDGESTDRALVASQSADDDNIMDLIQRHIIFHYHDQKVLY